MYHRDAHKLPVVLRHVRFIYENVIKMNCESDLKSDEKT